MASNRRQLLLSSVALVSLLVSNKVGARFLHGVDSSNKKLLTINLYNLQRGNLFPFINMFLANDRTWQYTQQAVADGYLTLGTNGYPSSMPAGGGYYFTEVGIYYTPGDSWTVEWTGAGTFGVGVDSNQTAGFVTSVSGTNPKVLTITLDTASIANWSSATTYGFSYSTLANFVKASDGNYYFSNSPANLNNDPTTDNGMYWRKVAEGFFISLQFTISSTPVTDIKCYRTSYATRLANGEIFDPNFLAAYSGYGILRLMKWDAAENSPLALWTNRTPANTHSLWGTTLNTQWYAGKLPAPTRNAWIAPIDPPGYVSGGWTDKMQVQAYLPSGSSISWLNISNIAPNVGNICQITTTTSHGFTTNDYVYFPEGLIGSSPPASIANWVSGGPYNAGDLVTVIGTGAGIYMAAQANTSTTSPYLDNGTNWTYISGSRASGSTSINQMIAGGKFYQVTVIDATNFTIPFHSNTWPTYTSGGQAVPRVTFSTPSLTAKPVIYYYTSAMSPSFINSQTNMIWVFTYDSELDVLLAQKNDASNGGSLIWGTPLETQVALCNALNCNGWFNIPHMADDTYVTNMATYIRDNLNSNLVAYYELSNEVWNGTYAETGYAGAKASLYAKTGLHGWTGPLTSYSVSATFYYSWYWYGWRFYGAMSIVKTVYSGQLSRCQCVLAHQAGAGSIPRNFGLTDPAIIGRHLAQNCNTAAPPVSIADAIATSSYFEMPGGTNGFVPTPISAQMVWQYCYGGQKATALASLDILFRNTFDPGSTENLYSYTQRNFPCWSNCASNPATDGSIPAVKWVQYEGGPNYSYSIYTTGGHINYDVNPYNPGTGPVTLTAYDLQNLLWGYYKSSYMQNLVNQPIANGTSLLQSYKAHGGIYPALFPLFGDWTVANAYMWGGSQPNEYGDTSGPLFTAYKNFNATGNP